MSGQFTQRQRGVRILVSRSPNISSQLLISNYGISYLHRLSNTMDHSRHYFAIGLLGYTMEGEEESLYILTLRYSKTSKILLSISTLL